MARKQRDSNFEYMARSWQVHRFHERVAGHLGDGATAYMTPAEARELGAALIAAADDCETNTAFSGSIFKTRTGILSGKQP